MWVLREQYSEPWTLSFHRHKKGSVFKKEKEKRGSTHLLQTAREQARRALEWSGDGDDLLSEIVQDVDGEGAHGAAALSTQAVVLLDSVEHVLTHGVADFILVVAFKTDEG